MFENKIEIISFIFIGLLSRSIAFDPSSDVQFELYTRDNRQVPQVIDTHGEPAIVNSKFQSTRPTRIFVHGYRSKHKVINRYAEAFLNAGDYNFIAVNWIEGASTVNYFTAKSRIKSVRSSFRRLNLFFFFRLSQFCFPGCRRHHRHVKI